MIDEIDETAAKREIVALGYHGPLGRWSLVRWSDKLGAWEVVVLHLSGHYTPTGDYTDRMAKLFRLSL